METNEPIKLYKKFQEELKTEEIKIIKKLKDKLGINVKFKEPKGLI